MLLNWLGDTDRISDRTRQLIEEDRNTVFFSALSIWEAEIKSAKGRLALPTNLLQVVRSKDFAELVFTSAHAEEAARLPDFHADPFDRGLIAQARQERLTFLTSDRGLSRYDVKIELN